MAHVTAKNVCLDYPIVTARSQSIRLNMMRVSSAGRLAQDARGQIRVSALDNVSFSIENGDRVALIGRNGAGKSTLLRVIAGIYPPTHGDIQVEGKISALLGISLPVDEELTGLEAVRYSCIIRGIGHERIPDVLRDVQEFTELGDYLNLPVRTYSSGMKVRLAFAVATYQDPDILVLDEGITAGDAFFLERSQQRAENFLDKASIIFLASHSDHVVRNLCNKGILLDQGRVVAAGGIDELYEIYMNIEAQPGKRPVVSIAGPLFDSEKPEESTVHPIASESAEDHGPECAFDGCETTFWQSKPALPVIEQAYIGVCFPTPVAPKTALLRQRIVDLQETNHVQTIAIEASDDGFIEDVRRAARIDLSPTPVLHRIPLAEGVSARWWRAIALSTHEPDLNSWDISRFDLLGDSLPAFHAGCAVASDHASPEVTAEQAFDPASELPWVSGQNGDDVKEQAWIGWDHGAANRPMVYGFELQQWDAGERPNTVSSVALECSDEPFAAHMTLVQEFEVPTNAALHRFQLTTTRRARFWRIRATSGTQGGHWGVSHLQFIKQKPKASDDADRSKS